MEIDNGHVLATHGNLAASQQQPGMCADIIAVSGVTRYLGQGFVAWAATFCVSKEDMMLLTW